MVRLYSLLFFFWVGLVAPVCAQRLDSTFWLDAQKYSSIFSVLPRPDGSTLVLGQQLYADGYLTGNLVCLQPDGTPNQAFQRKLVTLDLGNFYSGIPPHLLAYPDGRVLVIAYSDIAVAGFPIPSARMIRLLANGRPDSSFSILSPQPWPTVRAVALQPDGSILLGGNPTSLSPALIRLKPNGTLDTSFKPIAAAKNALDVVHTLAVQSDGRILVGGFFRSAVPALQRLLPSGEVDASFDGGVAAGGDVQQVLLRPDGRVVVAGRTSLKIHGAVAGLHQLLPSGQLDATFQAPASYGIVNADAERRLHLQPDGRLVLLASEPTNAPQIVRLLPSGQPDPQFQSPTLPLASQIASLDAAGNLLLAGIYTHQPGLQGSLLRLLPSGQPDPQFRPQLYQPGYVMEQMRLPDGRMILAGNFDVLGGTAFGGVACLLQGGEPDTDFARRRPFLGGYPSLLARQPDGRLLVGGNFGVWGRANQGGLVRLLATGQLDSTFQRLPAAYSVSALAVQPDGKILIGGIMATGFGGHHFARLTANGQSDYTFNISETLNSWLGESRQIILQPDGRMLLAGRQVHRVFSNGGYDASYQATELNSFANLLIRSAVLQPNGQLTLCGQMPSQLGGVRGTIVRLLADGHLDTSFLEYIGGSFSARRLYYQPDGKLLVGGYFQPNFYQGSVGLLRLDSQGEIDPSFQQLPGIGTVASFGEDAYGRLLLGGDMVYVPNPSRQQLGLLRLTSGSSVTASINRQVAPTLAVYPNPARTVVHVTWPGGSSPIRLRLFNAVGQLVREMAVPAGAVTGSNLPLEQLKPGLYWMRAEYALGTAVNQRLLIE